MNNINVYPLFPTPIGTFNYEDHKKLKDIILKHVKNDKKFSKPKYGNLTHIDNNHNTNFLNSFDDDGKFKNFLEKSTLFFVEEIMGNDIGEVIVTDCWLNKCDKSGYQPFHNHCNSYISGTYYLNYDKKKHSKLRVNSPFSFKDPGIPFISINSKKYTQFNGKDVTCDFIDEGMLVLWPSNLVHGYSENNYDDRITISMNFMPKQIINGPYSFTINV